MKSLTKTSFYCVIGIVIGMTFLVGCKKDDESHYLSASPRNLAFTQKADTSEVRISTNKKWKAASSESWCKISPSSGSSEKTGMQVMVAKNTSTEPRLAYISIREESGKRDSIKILQTGTTEMIALSDEAKSVSNARNSLTVVVASNVGDWEVSTDVEWILLPENISSGAKYCQLTIINNAYLERTGTVSFKQKNGGSVYKELKITQAEGNNLERGADSVVLVNLYKALSGNKWTSDKRWSFINPMTTWKGVTLSNEGRVAGLSLNNSNLEGQLISKIADLAELKTLSLIGNKLSGNIPGQLSQLTGLEELSLNGNLYTGNIPGDVTKISSLKKLNLSNNKFNGNIPDLSALTNLEFLSLSDNQLSGDIPNSAGKLSKLQYLYLNNNQLSGSIPSSIGDLKELKELKLFSNTLSGNIPEQLGNLTNLAYLEMHENRLTGSIPASLGNLTKLVRLFLNDNQLSGLIPTSFEKLVLLENLSLNKNQLTGKIPSELGRLVKLESLLLHDNQLDENIPGALGNLTGLMTLYLSDNNLTGSVPPEIGNIRTLKFLYLNGNRLSGDLPGSILAHPNRSSFHLCPQQAGYGFSGNYCQ